jgi:glycerophosphoryl diester phosphodiesterase
MRLPRHCLLAHRGASAERPENTLDAFARALDLGADGVETDAHLTRDGAVILAHDDDALRTAGVRARWSDVDLAELQRWDAGATFTDRDGASWRGRGARVPTLAEALAAFPDTFFNVDIKSRRPAMVTAVVSVVRAAEAEGRVLLTSFDEATLRRVRALGYAGATGLGASAALAALFGPLPMRALPASRGTALQIPDRYRSLDLGQRWVRDRCDRLGLRLDYWVVNDPARARALLARGADGVVTDDVAALRPVVSALSSARAARAPSS